MIWATVIFSAVYLAVNGFSKKLSLGLIFTALVLSLFSSTTMIFFGKGTHVLFQWHLLVISRESLARGAQIGLRTFVYSLMGLILMSTTEPVLFFYSLMQQLKVPAKYAYGCLAAFRMLPIMAEEFIHIRQAMKVRGMTRKKGMKARYERVKRYAITLLAQSIRRAQRTAVAMEAKQFSMTRKRTYYYQVVYSRYDLLFACLIMAAVIGSFALSHYFPLTPYQNVLED